MTSSNKALVVYTAELAPKQKLAEEAGVEGVEMLQMISGYAITTQEQYAALGEMLREVKGKIKFLDEERKISVGPLNEEVKRVNDWFRPALDSLKKISEHIVRLMSAYMLQQKREEDRLLAEAEEAAKAVLATNPDVNGAQVQATQALVQQAAEAVAPKVQGITSRPVWTFEVTNPALLERRFLKPDLDAIAAWVKEHGDKDVPAGVEVRSDVRFTVRQ